MEKDFDRWNELKKNIESRNILPFCYAREIWWSSLGLNVGSEEDGKNDVFERPVLILRVLNVNMVRVLPLTSTIKNDRNHVSIKYGDKFSSVKLSQLKTISTKRLTRKIAQIDPMQFEIIVKSLKESLV